MIGIAKDSIGLIQLVILSPELNQTTISESRYHRDNVISMDRNKVRDSNIGINLTILKPNMVVIASFGIAPFAASCKR